MTTHATEKHVERVNTTAVIEKKEVNKKDLKWQKERDAEMVQGVFKFYEVPGGTLSFVFHKFKGDKVARYDLTDGKVYRIPRGVAEHLNKDCWYPLYEYIPGDSEAQTALPAAVSLGQQALPMRVQRKMRRCGFQSIEFMDMDDLGQPSNLVEVTSL